MSVGKHSGWDAALRIIEALRARGHRALLAGGCVRDRLLNLTPKDYDVATDATPAQVVRVFPRARLVGAAFGVVMVRKFGHDVEVATFRADGTYSDGRRPDEVVFGDETQDARRRDFTVNGMYFDPIEGRVIDYVGGQEDLRAGVLRTIGEPARRLAEDHLRMLRAVRFAARLGFQLESGTLAEIRRLAHRLRDISPERIWQELEFIITAPTRTVGWNLLCVTGLRPHVAAAWEANDADDATIAARLAALPAKPVDSELALAVLLVGRAMPQVRAICRELRLSNRQAAAVLWLVGSLDAVRSEAALDLAALKRLMSGGDWSNLCALLHADLTARHVDTSPWQRLCARAARIPAEEIAPPPLLNGDRLKELGMPAGRRFGEILRNVYTAQLNETVRTSAEAESLARRLIAGPES
ncbi:MAG: CCA tRNA nucleotidyltransferase [Planctomycetes bacterium]|nr:CCA tRNA nucleotidyltransferase [Planctomycetota bacterium]